MCEFDEYGKKLTGKSVLLIEKTSDDLWKVVSRQCVCDGYSRSRKRDMTDQDVYGVVRTKFDWLKGYIVDPR